MSTQHTPGPWVAHQRPTVPIEYGHHVTTDDGLTICYVSYQLPSRIGGEVVEATRIANANLIAASPELLAVLCDCLPFIDDANDIAQFFPESAATNACRGAVKRAHEIIAKATAPAGIQAVEKAKEGS